MKPSAIHSPGVLDRLLRGTGLHKDAQLAELLGVTPQAVSQARRKGKVPEHWIMRLAVEYHLSLDWLFFGQTPPAPAASDPVRPVVRLPQPGAPALPEVELVLVPLVSARLAAGMGSLETDATVIGHFAFREDWICRKGNPDRMVLMRVTGDSMEPEIRHGDMVLVDQGRRDIFGHAMYAVAVNEEIYIKQIETLPGRRMVLRSLNERYAPIEVDLRGDLADSVHVIGRVVWWCREA